MPTKTYNTKSNATRAHKTVTTKLGKYASTCEVVGCKQQGFALHIKLAHNTPTELSAYLTKQGHNFVILAAPQPVAAPAPKAPATPKAAPQPRYAGLVYPKAGNGKCYTIWQACEAWYALHGTYPKPSNLKTEMAQKGINTELSTFTRQLYAWRKYTSAKLNA